MGNKLLMTMDCKAGMILSKDVFTQKGVVLVPSGTTLTDSIIERIISSNIPSVWISDGGPNIDSSIENSSDIYSPLENSPAMKEAKKEYTVKIEKVKKIFSDFSEGNNLDKDAKEIVASTINFDKHSGDLLRCMRQLRSIDNYIFQHSLNVSSLCFLIGQWMNLSQTQLEELTLAGLVHDIGKTKIDPAILNKKSNLTKGDVLEIQKHSEYGYQILKEHTHYSDDILKAVLMHHEYDDGSGYPSKLKGKDIHQYAKIISVANLYSSITMDRIYEKTDTPFSVFEIFESVSANKFDPLVVYTLMSNIAMYYIGDNVQLSNGIMGRIIFIDQEFPAKPLVKSEDDTIIDLKIEKEIKIASILI